MLHNLTGKKVFLLIYSHSFVATLQTLRDLNCSVSRLKHTINKAFHYTLYPQLHWLWPAETSGTPPSSCTNTHPSHLTSTLTQIPTPPGYNQSCRGKQSESTGKTVGANVWPPFSAVRGPDRAPKAQITPHIMRGLGQQAVPLCLTIGHTETQANPQWYHCWTPALFRSPLWFLHRQLPAKPLYMSL